MEFVIQIHFSWTIRDHAREVGILPRILLLGETASKTNDDGKQSYNQTGLKVFPELSTPLFLHAEM
jgi:hypothetical protein